jgi:hypothetical protein
MMSGGADVRGFLPVDRNVASPQHSHSAPVPALQGTGRKEFRKFHIPHRSALFWLKPISFGFYPAAVPPQRDCGVSRYQRSLRLLTGGLHRSLCG